MSQHRHFMRSLLSSAALAAALLPTAHAAGSSFTLTNSFAFQPATWDAAWSDGLPGAQGRYTAYAAVHNPAAGTDPVLWSADERGATARLAPLGPGNIGVHSDARMEFNAASALAATDIQLFDTSVGASPKPGTVGPAIFGSTFANGSAAVSGSGSGAFAAASAEVLLPNRAWGDAGSVWLQPGMRIGTQLSGPAPAVGPRSLTDSVVAAWVDAGGQDVAATLLSVSFSYSDSDAAARLSWNASGNSLTLNAAQRAEFKLDLSSPYVAAAQRGRLELIIEDGKVAAGSLASGVFASLLPAQGTAAGDVALALGALSFDYQLPVSSYSLKLGGGLGPAVATPEPGMVWLMGLGMVAAVGLRRVGRLGRVG